MTDPGVANNRPMAIQVIGPGRLGSALPHAMGEAGLVVDGPYGRGDIPPFAPIVLLCVPDDEIAGAARRVSGDSIVAHCAGSRTLELLAPHECFSLHPLLTVTKATVNFAGVGCAVEASTPRARAACMLIVNALGMQPFEMSDALRPLYHAAASVGSNYMVTLADAAERLMAQAGVRRELLVPLVMAAVQNWSALGPQALTGPIARGDEDTVARQRAAIAGHAPDTLALWDALADATRQMVNEA
jgi:predicted short-subunit dehydrogenase-like oxidoreductase (DUF2520 family)